MIRQWLHSRQIIKQRKSLCCGTNVFIDPNVDIYCPQNMKIGNDVHIQFGCKFFADAVGGG